MRGGRPYRFWRRPFPNGEHRFVFNPRGRTRVLGLDPGLSVTGYGLVEGAGGLIRALDAGVIRTDSRASLVDRLAEVQAGLRDVLAEWRPAAIAVEDVFAHPGFPRSGILIGHVCGVICVAAAEHGLEVDPIPPASVKRAMVSSGRADKRQVQRMVRTLLRLDRDPVSHVADALAVALVAFAGHPRAAARITLSGAPV